MLFSSRIVFLTCNLMLPGSRHLTIMSSSTATAAATTSAAIVVSQRMEDFVSERMKMAGCVAHDVAHCHRVANLARRLAQAQQANPVIAFYGGLLHDVLDSKLYSAEAAQSAESQVISLLAQEDALDASACQDIISIIKNVGYKNMIRPRTEFDPWTLSAEYRCVQDADLLDAIGAVGVARCMAFSGRCNRKLFGRDLLQGSETISREVYLQSQKNKEGSAVAHFFEKLLRIKALLLTEEGKRLGEKRHQHIVSFLEMLDDELIDAEDESAGAISKALPSFP